jgi:hypothetical protein
MLTSVIGGIEKNYPYETDFPGIAFSPSANFLTADRLTVVLNFGCNDDDWENVAPYPVTGSVILFIHSENCSVFEKSIIGQKYNINDLLIYDGDLNATRLASFFVYPDIAYPAMILSYKLGVQLVEATQNYSSTNASVRMYMASGNKITVLISSENLCADTLTGDKTQTIIIGSHSDSIENSSGINDNGRFITSAY